MRILITGDLVVNQYYDATANINQEVIDLFAQSACNIINLEAPVTESTSKILKTGPHLKADKQSTLDVLKRLNIHIAALANNHIKDYDEQGVLDTIDFCVSNNIKPIGAGKNLEQAASTTVLDTPEGKIALINIAENEWASAEENTAGANGMNLIKDTRAIQQAKKENDFVFVIVHGGHEYYNLPSPRMQEQYRFYAEQGADLVVGHHTHCISGYETHEGTPIYYSLGNFLFTKSSPNEEWYTGLVLEVSIQKGKLETTLHPVSQAKESFELKLLEGSASSELLEKVAAFSKIVADENKLCKEWAELVATRYKNYSSYWSPKIFIRNRYVSALLNKLGLTFTTTRGLAYYLNLMRCEAHRDLSHAVLQERLKK
ncbi:MAG: CapA family protein [Pseudomonadaceae bacterium]|nr:CapA family protein [Pseudomonadaceae bacterium]